MPSTSVFQPTASMNRPAPTYQVTGASYPSAGQTTNFQLFYKASLGATGSAIAAGILANCEQSLNTLKPWFSVVPPNLPFKVYVTDEVQGAMHYGCADTEVYIGSIKEIAPANKLYSLLLAAEIVEVFEAAVGLDWNCGYSNGEALSRVLAADIFPGAQTPDLVTVPDWLYKSAPDGTSRPNWIDSTDAADSNSFSVGCSVLFLNWLHFDLGRPWRNIIKSGAPTLGGVYLRLIGSNDGWKRFQTLVDSQFAATKPHITGDNPFKPSLVATIQLKLREMLPG
jgi:hypothetical protein